jgi:hypothetical protein
MVDRCRLNRPHCFDNDNTIDGRPVYYVLTFGPTLRVNLTERTEIPYTFNDHRASTGQNFIVNYDTIAAQESKLIITFFIVT